MPRKPKKEITYLTEQEVDAFFRVIRNARDKALFRVMYHHGFRASEPGKLMLSDYRPGPGKPRLRVVRLKGSVTGVEHRLLDLELAALKAWLRVRGMAPGPLFPRASMVPSTGASCGC
jgi:type 1 fimbriae regulatory protein FimB